MPLHHQIPPTHVHRLPGIPPPSAATNGSATPPSRMPVHHHHGIHLPPPTVMLSMPPPSVTMQQGGVVTTQAPPIHTMQQNMHIQPYIHHHSPVNRNVNGNGEVHLQQHHYNKKTHTEYPVWNMMYYSLQVFKKLRKKLWYVKKQKYIAAIIVYLYFFIYLWQRLESLLMTIYICH